MTFLRKGVILAFVALTFLVTHVPRTCNGESYPAYPHFLEYSYSGRVTAIVKALSSEAHRKANESVEITLLSRIDKELSNIAGSNRLHSSLQSGVVSLVKEFTLDYEPGLVRVSDSRIAIVDRYGVNKDWLKTNAAIRILTLDGQQETLLELETIVSDSSTCVHLSGATISWCRDAWFSKDGSRLYVGIRRLPQAEKIHSGLIQIDPLDGAVKVVKDHELIEVFSQSDVRFFATLFDIADARGIKTKELQDLAHSSWMNEELPTNVRLYAASYLFFNFQTKEALVFVRSIADWQGVLYPSYSPLDTPDDLALPADLKMPSDLVLMSTLYADPLGSAKKILRRVKQKTD